MSESAARYWRYREKGGVADLSARVKLRLTGVDRVRFLNGQVTANVSKLQPGHAQPACITTAKGRLCGEAFLHAISDALLVDADASLREPLPPRLEKYIIADDVTLTDLTDELHLAHVIGPVAPAADITRVALSVDRAMRFGCPGWDLFFEADAFAQIWPAFIATTVELDADLQELIRIEAGVPRWGAELDENTLPPEAGLDRTHVDYHKGCYIGQEVISRLKSVGHVNRELTGFVSSGAPLTVGASLFAPGDNDRSVGRITSTAFSFALEKPIALGYLKRGAGLSEVTARSAQPNGAETLVVPYALPFVLPTAPSSAS